MLMQPPQIIKDVTDPTEIKTEEKKLESDSRQ